MQAREPPPPKKPGNWLTRLGQAAMNGNPELFEAALAEADRVAVREALNELADRLGEAELRAALAQAFDLHRAAAIVTVAADDGARCVSLEEVRVRTNANRSWVATLVNDTSRKATYEVRFTPADEDGEKVRQCSAHWGAMGKGKQVKELGGPYDGLKALESKLHKDYRWAEPHEYAL